MKNTSLLFPERLHLAAPPFSLKENKLRMFRIHFLQSYALLCALLSAGCTDAVEPAGPGQYENPSYPSVLFGYTAIPASSSFCFSYQGRVYVLNRTNQMSVSFSASDPNLGYPDSTVEKDTLLLGFSPGKASFDSNTEMLFVSDDVSNDIYRVPVVAGDAPVFLRQCESIVADLFAIENGNSLLICFLGPEWLVRKINAFTGEVEGEFLTGWPISRAALSPDGERLLLSNSGKQFLIEISTSTMEMIDSIPLPERCGPFLYNTSGNIVVFNQHTTSSRVFLIDGETKSILDVVETFNPYQYCSLMPGTDVVLAPRRSNNRVSVLNSDNMVFAPSIFCFSSAEMAFSSPENDFIVILSDSPGRAYVYSHQ
jgi:hypothetical protein